MSELNQEQALTVQEPHAKNVTMWNDDKALARSWKAANMLSKTALVPDNYRGQPENCLIALDVANRVNISPLMVMQNLTIVQGKPAWNGQSSIALVNGCGRFSPLKFIYSGEGENFGCVAQAQRLADGEVCESERITLAMARDEGWSTKKGSKWLTMPKQMMMYRAGAFFARTYCPDVMLGIYTTDELTDIGKGDTAQPKEKIVFQEDAE
jgi:hypothetical protein